MKAIYIADAETDDVDELFITDIGNPGVAVKLNAHLVGGGQVSDFQISPHGDRVLYRADQEQDDVFELYLVSLENPGQATKVNGLLVDGGGDLSKEQMDKVFIGIKPALDRLEMVFPSEKAYLQKMSEPPYIQPWSPAIETYYRYEIEPTEDGVRTNIQPAHIQEEAANIRKVTCATFYPKVNCEVLILRASKGLLSQEDILLPAEVIDKMMAEIANTRRFDVEGVNHYGIVFQPHEARDRAIREFLAET